MPYKARVYPLVDDETIIAQMRTMKLELPDGTPVAPEIWVLDSEEKKRMQRAYGTQGCYIDLFYVDDGPTAGPLTIYADDNPTFYEIRSKRRHRPRNTRVRLTYAKRKRLGLI